MINRLGFTLIELIMVISLIGLLLFVALPSSQQLYQKNQLTLITNRVKNAVSYARAMALAQGQSLVLSPLNDLDWSLGLVLFIDNKLHKKNKDNILQVWQWQPNAIKITWDGFQSKNYIIFASTLTHSMCNGHFTFLINGQIKEKLIVNRLCHSHKNHL